MVDFLQSALALLDTTAEVVRNVSLLGAEAIQYLLLTLLLLARQHRAGTAWAIRRWPLRQLPRDIGVHPL